MKRDSDIRVVDAYPDSDGDYKTEEDPDIHPREEFKKDISTALSLSEQSIKELRLFVDPWINAGTDLCVKSTITTSFESILSKFPTISRLFIHTGFYHGNGLDGFQQESAITQLGKGQLTTISSTILPLFAKHKISLRTLSFGRYYSLDRDWGTYKGSEVTPSSVFNPELPSHAFEQLESFDMGINLPIVQTNSSKEQCAEMTTQAHAIARFVGRLPALTELSLRWDLPYHKEKIPPLVHEEFPSRVLASLGGICKLWRLRLRGFMAVTRASIHSFLLQNVELEHIEIGSWVQDSGALRSCLHYIRYSRATCKFAIGFTYYDDRSDPLYEVTKWKPTGCVTVRTEGTDIIEAEMERSGNIDPPAERSEGVHRILSLLIDRRLIVFMDLEEARAKRAAKDTGKANRNGTWDRKRKNPATVNDIRDPPAKAARH
ncbi:hypothetical protein EJ08DRAFT_692581 [Tothia fuscella]|uniref:Uncharacterized protein n=1 Tax=Tothia fuscella TaxID=1048955 RepID=A0A9P4P0S8_9PEZI|nr:hypothetical protein EJ08DRAFT_692581 [Tothia fuscella]